MKKIYIPGPEEIAEKYYMIIPNIFYDEFMPVLEPMAWKILSYFIRNTYGFKREKYSVGYQQVARDCNIGTRRTKDHISDLVNAGILVITKEADRRNRKTREYRLIQGNLFI